MGVIKQGILGKLETFHPRPGKYKNREPHQAAGDINNNHSTLK